MTRIFLFLWLTATFCTNCNPYKRYQPTHPTPITAKRVMLVVLPIREVGLPLSSFFAVCDSNFKKNNITKMSVTLKVEDFDATTLKKDPIQKPLMEFQPDCLIFFIPEKLERNRGLSFVRYRTFILPAEPADYLLPDHTEDNKKINLTYINTVELTAIRSVERDRINGISAAKKFLNELKKHLSNIQ